MWPPAPAPWCRHCEALLAAGDELSLLTAVTGCCVAYPDWCPWCRPTPQHCHFVRRPQTSWCWPSCLLLPDARPAVAEAARVLRPGGWLLTATWGTQLGTGADVVVREELDAVGAPTFPVLERSDSLTDTPDRMAVLLNGGDFDNIDTSSRPLAATLDARAALAMKTGCGVLGWRYRRLDPASQEAVHRRAAERLAALPPEAFIDRSEVLLTTARRTR